MKVKNAALLLIIASSIWLVDLLYFTWQRFTGDSAKYYKDKAFEAVMSSLLIILPVTFLLFAITLYNKKPASNHTALPDDVFNKDMISVEVPNMTFGKWMATFFVSIIPVVGFVFLIIWAMDKDNPIRKNWALASLVFLVFQSLIIFAALFVIYKSLNSYKY